MTLGSASQTPGLTDPAPLAGARQNPLWTRLQATPGMMMTMHHTSHHLPHPGPLTEWVAPQTPSTLAQRGPLSLAVSGPARLAASPSQTRLVPPPQAVVTWLTWEWPQACCSLA